jgi:hypothetical protein
VQAAQRHHHEHADAIERRASTDEDAVDVDVDDMGHDFIKSMPIKAHDQTSNQKFVDLALAEPENQELLAQVAKELKGEGWLAIYTRAVRACHLLPMQKHFVVHGFRGGSLLLTDGTGHRHLLVGCSPL